MLKSYFLIAWRNLAKQKVLSFINIFGLSVGVACFSLFLLYALNEFGFDGFHRNAKNLYRAYDGDKVYDKHTASGNVFTPMPLGPSMKQDLPGVVDYTRFIQSFETFLRQGDVGKRELIAFADPSFLRMFSFRLKEGNPATALSGAHSLVVTEGTAKRLFGEEDAMGKSIQVQVLGNAFEVFTVTGVAENIPANSSIAFNILANIQVIETTAEGRGDIGNWYRNSFQTFVQLQPGSRLPSNEQLLLAFKSKYIPFKGQGSPNLFALEPITEMHTDTNFGFLASLLKVPAVDPSSIWILLSIAAGVLLISCINFTTLSVGRSAHRAREVGVRKAIGGRAADLRLQFLGEAFLMTLIAFTLGYILALALLPSFNEYTGRDLSFSVGRYPALPWMYAGLVVLVTALSGGYPAWMLSRFRAVDVLKSKLRFGGANGFTRSLVTLQFVLSTGLIIGAVVMVGQLRFMQSRNPGFDKENVIVLEARDIPVIRDIYARFKQALADHPGIIGTASADNGLGYHEGISVNGYDHDGVSFTFHAFYVDPNYIPVLGMRVIAGRNFSNGIGSDTVRSVLINESMVRALGWTPVTAVGRQLKSLRSADTAAPPTVIGVVKDFNFQAMNEAVQPQLFNAFSGGMPYHFFVRIRPGDPSQALAAIQTAWNKAAPGYSFQYNFLDEDLDRYYFAEVRLCRIVGWAGGISIILACLGLLGLAMLTALNRTKEIGIRKVLGASLHAIVGLISRDFLRLVSLAFVIAAPLAWYFMHRWLNGYYYRIHLSPWVFVLTGAGVLGVAWITVAFQAFRAARVNPVKSLKVE